MERNLDHFFSRPFSPSQVHERFREAAIGVMRYGRYRRSEAWYMALWPECGQFID
jgi:hypothetical protein